MFLALRRAPEDGASDCRSTRMLDSCSLCAFPTSKMKTRNLSTSTGLPMGTAPVLRLASPKRARVTCAFHSLRRE